MAVLAAGECGAPNISDTFVEAKGYEPPWIEQLTKRWQRRSSWKLPEGIFLINKINILHSILALSSSRRCAIGHLGPAFWR